VRNNSQRSMQGDAENTTSNPVQALGRARKNQLGDRIANGLEIRIAEASTASSRPGIAASPKTRRVTRRLEVQASEEAGLKEQHHRIATRTSATKGTQEARKGRTGGVQKQARR